MLVFGWAHHDLAVVFFGSGCLWGLSVALASSLCVGLAWLFPFDHTVRGFGASVRAGYFCVITRPDLGRGLGQ